MLPVLPELAGLLPNRGLRRGSTVAVGNELDRREVGGFVDSRLRWAGNPHRVSASVRRIGAGSRYTRGRSRRCAAVTVVRGSGG